jgi:hypothetical protein
VTRLKTFVATIPVHILSLEVANTIFGGSHMLLSRFIFTLDIEFLQEAHLIRSFFLGESCEDD